MSMPPQPPGYPPPPPPPGYSPYAAAKPPKRRPSAWWFLPGAVALVIAIAAAAYGGVTVARLFHTDVYVDAATQAQVVQLGSGRHMLFMTDGSQIPVCVVQENGAPLPLVDETGVDATIDLDSGSWAPFASFSTHGAAIQISCQGEAGTSIRIGAPAGDAQFIRMAVAFIAAAVLGLIGLAASIVVAVLFFGRPSRKVTG